jgi:hypothetical protein
MIDGGGDNANDSMITVKMAMVLRMKVTLRAELRGTGPGIDLRTLAAP